MTQYSAALDDNLVVSDTGSVVAQYSVVSGESVTISADDSFTWTAGGGINEQARITGILAPNLIYYTIISDLAKLAQTQSWGILTSLSENISISDAITAIVGATIFDKIRVSDVLGGQVSYHLALIEAAKIYETFARFFGGDIVESAVLSSSLVVNYRAVVSLLDSMYISDWNHDLSRIIFNVQYTEHADCNDTQLLQMIYSGQIMELGLVRALYVSPDGNVVTWAINTRTNAVTQYDNWQFNSFATVGRKYIAAGPDGLYELDGERDLTENIPTRIAGGMVEMNGSKFVGLKGVYLGMRAHGEEMFLKLESGDGREWLYRIKPNPGLMTTKVTIGKGLRMRYLGWELTTIGQDFDLGTIEFVLMMFDRRV